MITLTLRETGTPCRYPYDENGFYTLAWEIRKINQGRHYVSKTHN
jgi:hypothetical protein